MRISHLLCAWLVLAGGVSAAQSLQISTGLSGRISDQAGNVLSGVTIQISSKELPDGLSLVTDDSGEYNFVGLPPGKYTVTATLGSVSVTKTITLKAGAAVSGNFVLPIVTPTTGTVEGTVKDKNGKPLKANIVITDQNGNSVKTDCKGDGTYSKSGIGAGQQRVTASLAGYKSSSRDVTVPAKGTARADFVLVEQ